MLMALLLAAAEPVPAPPSEVERKAGLEVRDIVASNGRMVRAITTKSPPEEFYHSIPQTSGDYFNDPKIMAEGGWSGYGVFELHRRGTTTPMVTISFLQFTEAPASLSKVTVFGQAAASKAVRFENVQVGQVPCLENGLCPGASTFEVVIQPKQFRRLLRERRGIPVTFVSPKFGRISVTVPQYAVDAVLEVAGGT